MFSDWRGKQEICAFFLFFDIVSLQFNLFKQLYLNFNFLICDKFSSSEPFVQVWERTLIFGLEVDIWPE